MIINLLSESTAKLQTITRRDYCSIEVFLLRSYRQDYESIAKPRIDRPSLTSPLFRPQLKQIRLALQRLHMRRRQVWPKILQLLHDVEDRLAISTRLHVLEVDDRIAVEFHDPSSRLLAHSPTVTLASDSTFCLQYE